jgi:hypothetical protein
MSNILKVRSNLMISLNSFIVIIFCVAGQSFNRRSQLSHIYPFIFQTTQIFDTLSSCSWYEWNAENKKILLIFLSNGLKPLGFSFAGVILDYKFALAVS